MLCIDFHASRNVPKTCRDRGSVHDLMSNIHCQVALALLAYSNPHILVMDEPTNHLDLDAIQALVAALTSFKGGVVIVSHDSHFINAVCDEIWHVENNTAYKFNGIVFAIKY